MKYATTKNSRISISRIGFGCANFGGIGSAVKLVGKGDSEKDCHKILDIALASGINYFDTATTYGAGESERILGKWLKTLSVPRDKVVISSKISARVSRLPWRRGLSKTHISRALELSLKRLQLDYLDLLYIHAPDPGTPLEETLGALNTAVEQGKVRKLGASNVDMQYLRNTLEVSRSSSLAEYEVVQNSYSFLNRKDEKDLIPFCVENQILYVGYGPLSGGLLTGKYKRGCEYPRNTRLYLRSELYESILTDRMFSSIETLRSYAQTMKIALPTLMYAWLYEKSLVDSFLIGARNELQFKAVTDVLRGHLSNYDWQELDNILAADDSAHVPET
jgi:aryl-alcohol dehydrogenase-like predicted oxidoreductase